MLRSGLTTCALFMLSCSPLLGDIPHDSYLTGEVNTLARSDLRRFGISIDVTDVEAPDKDKRTAKIIMFRRVDPDLLSSRGVDVSLSVVADSGEIISISHPAAIEEGDLIRVEAPFFLRIGLSARCGFDGIERGVMYLIDIRT